MNISNLSNKYSTWIKSQPKANNTVSKLAGILNQTDVITASVAEKEISSNEVQQKLYSGEVVKSSMKNYSGSLTTECEIVPSSEREYTIQDAIQYQYNKQFRFSIDDLMNGRDIDLTGIGSTVTQSFIDELKQNGITEETYDSGRAEFYIMGLDEENTTLSSGVAYLASGYAVSKKHIQECFHGAEQEMLLADLTTKYNTAIDQLASSATYSIGGFFEEYGISGESQKIKDSITNAYQEAVQKYSDFISNNSDYAGLAETDNEWLNKDDSYMAGQLRTVMKSETGKPVKAGETEFYSMEELDKTKEMISEIRSYESGSNSDRSIGASFSEEEIGFKLAELGLKGEIFEQYSNVSTSLIRAIKKSIAKFTETLADKLNEKLIEERKRIAEPDRVPNLDKDRIFSVYNHIMDIYKKTGDVTKALLHGAEYGKTQHMENTQKLSYLSRYGQNGSMFWNNFFHNTLKYKNTNFTAMMGKSNCYIDSESGVELLSANWNNYVSKWTDNTNLKLNVNMFSAYA